MVARFCENAKTTEIVHFKRVNFIYVSYVTIKPLFFKMFYSIPQWCQQSEDKGNEMSIKYFDYYSIVEWAFVIKGA